MGPGLVVGPEMVVGSEELVVGPCHAGMAG